MNLQEMYEKAYEESKPKTAYLVVSSVFQLSKLLVFVFCMTRTFVPRDLSWFTVYVMAVLFFEVTGHFMITWSQRRLHAATTLILKLAMKAEHLQNPALTELEVIMGTKTPKG